MVISWVLVQIQILQDRPAKRFRHFFRPMIGEHGAFTVVQNLKVTPAAWRFR